MVEPRRFSDQELAEMRATVDQLSGGFEEHNRKFELVLSAVKDNTDATHKLANETRDIVAWGRDLQGAARVGKSVQSFALWLLKWGAVGVGIVAVVKWVRDLTGV